MQASVILFRAVGLPAEIDQEFYVHSTQSMTTLLVDHAKADLQDLASRIPPDLLEGYDVRIGTPWDAICREASARNVDLVVLGSHGFGGLDRLLGTTASKVVNHCDRSVWVVRPSPTHAA